MAESGVANVSHEPSLVSELMSRVIPCVAQEIDRHIQMVKECFEENMFQLSELIERYYARKDVTSLILIDLQKINTDLTDLKNESNRKIENSRNTYDLNSKKNQIETEIKRIETLLTTVDGLILFQEFHRDSIIATQARCYIEAVANGIKAGEQLKVFGGRIPEHLSVHIRREYELNMELIRDTIRNIWFEVVRMKGVNNIVKFDDAITVEVILCPIFESYNFEEICLMLSDLKIFSEMFRQFSHLYLQFLIEPIFRIRTISLVVNDFGLEDKISFIHQNGFNNSEKVPKFLTNIFKIVSRLFTPFKLGKECLQKLGFVVWAPIIQGFESQLLEPEMSESLKSDWLKLEEDLVSFGIITEDQKVFANLIKKLVTSFREKRQAIILDNTRTLLKSDISLTELVSIQINEQKSTNFFPKNMSEANLQSHIHLSNHPLTQSELSYLDENLFIFPACQVSIFAIEFIENCRDLMAEATQNEIQHAFDVVKTIRYMLQMFLSFTPFYHKSQINNVVRSTAVFYNNCMFVSHHLVTLGFEFRPHMPEPLNTEICTFIDFIPVIRNLGEELWLEMLNKQKLEAKEFIAVLQNSISGLDGDKGELVQKSFISLISHLDQLSRAWKDVLPLHILRGTIGILLDTIFVICINSVFQLTDISAKDASQAANIFSLLSNRCKPLFHLETETDTETEILREVCEEWIRFNELIILLDASLKQIKERWGDGIGPLGLNFKVSEIRNFVRGSFKTSDKRAQLLTCIV
ncbi:Centromere/kinetochore protein zw10-like [Oopsacas minuta]|uniref:Centromere/kinetochore protein zw10-like n=1 Tax=Oopsacas minuta TaxID=111878 RepID=A0AAV7K7L3_9METZ|nr:Centromere/kinetochore protein zw10-like [Oopsacas minuta]